MLDVELMEYEAESALLVVVIVVSSVVATVDVSWMVMVLSAEELDESVGEALATTLET